MDSQVAKPTSVGAPAQATSALQGRGIVWFLALAFGVAWALWGVAYLQGGLHNPAVFLVLSAIAMWSPGLAAIACARLLAPLDRQELGWRWGKLPAYLWAYPAILWALAASTGLSLLLGLQRINWALQELRSQLQVAPPPFDNPAIALSASAAFALLLGGIINLPFALGEELGWRGYLLAWLRPLGLVRASVVIGLIWGIWHAPAIAMGYNYPGHPWLGILAMTVFTVLWSPVFTWLRQQARSVVAAAFLHGLLNATSGLLPVLLTPADPLLRAPLGLAGLLALLPLAGICVWALARTEKGERG